VFNCLTNLEEEEVEVEDKEEGSKGERERERPISTIYLINLDEGE
jgi:hypothetical protein